MGDDEDDAEESDPEDDLDETNDNIMRKGGDKSIKVPRAKLLKFHENRRPAYWGTWTKQSKFISGRRPFGRDEDRFDYEYDSDDDWEEEEEGESLSDDEKDKEDEEEDDAVGGFTPFRVKENMRLVPLVRADTEVAK